MLSFESPKEGGRKKRVEKKRKKSNKKSPNGQYCTNGQKPSWNMIWVQKTALRWSWMQ